LNKARDHFHGLREAKPDLVGYLLCDRVDSQLRIHADLVEYMWRRREIENYLCQPETLGRFAEANVDDLSGGGPLWAPKHRRVMDEVIRDFVAPAALRDPNDQWWADVKASDDFLDRVFREYLRKLGLKTSLMTKKDYHKLAPYVQRELISPEVSQVLDGILAVRQRARPRV
jgi:hypothetical protein